MLPAKRGEVGEQSIWDRITAAAGSLQCAAQIDGVPQHDCGRDQGQVACAALLVLCSSVVQPSKTMEAHGPGQRFMAFTLVQLCCGLPAQYGLLQPVQGVEGPLDASDFAQRQCQAVLPGVGAEALEHQRGPDRAGAHRGCQPEPVIPLRHGQLFIGTSGDERRQPRPF